MKIWSTQETELYGFCLAMTNQNYTVAIILGYSNISIVASDVCCAQASGHSCWDAHLEESTL